MSWERERELLVPVHEHEDERSPRKDAGVLVRWTLFGVGMRVARTTIVVLVSVS